MFIALIVGFFIFPFCGKSFELKGLINHFGGSNPKNNRDMSEFQLGLKTSFCQPGSDHVVNFSAESCEGTQH